VIPDAADIVLELMEDEGYACVLRKHQKSSKVRVSNGTHMVIVRIRDGKACIKKDVWESSKLQVISEEPGSLDKIADAVRLRFRLLRDMK
jgi:hypothetical protein